MANKEFFRWSNEAEVRGHADYEFAGEAKIIYSIHLNLMEYE
jgi:hypothetical protein